MGMARGRLFVATGEVNVLVEEGHDSKDDGDHKDESSKEEKLYCLDGYNQEDKSSELPYNIQKPVEHSVE